MEIKIDPQKVLEELESEQAQDKGGKRVVLTAKVEKGKLVNVKSTLPPPEENDEQIKK